MSIVETEEVVHFYMKRYFKSKGYSFRNINKDKGYHKEGEKVRRVCDSLVEISDELRTFIKQVHNDKFNQMMTSVGTTMPTYKDFHVLAHELFAEGVSWVKITTLLVFGSELAVRAIQNSNTSTNENDDDEDTEEEDGIEDDNDEQKNDDQGEATDSRRSRRSDRMVTHIIECLARYIDENLCYWIAYKQRGWIDITNWSTRGYPDHMMPPKKNNMRYYFRMATLATFVGGLYFCSKFFLQK